MFGVNWTVELIEFVHKNQFQVFFYETIYYYSSTDKKKLIDNIDTFSNKKYFYNTKILLIIEVRIC